MGLSRRIVLIALSGLVLLVLITAWGFRETSKPSFCSSCHLIEPYTQSWQTSTHAAKGVTCIDCHFEPGAIGYTKGKFYSFIKLTQFAAGQTEKKPEAAKLVLRAACLQCHEYIRDPTDPRYPKNIVVQGIAFPHDFHLNTANLSCADCHSGIVHGVALVGPEKPQAAADPAFCNKCHTGDIAPILFLPIQAAGRVHPGAPKIDVAVWRNNHWRLAKQGASIDGVAYDKIQPETCAACHQDPTQAKACKGCHFARVPEFSASPKAERASFIPMVLFFYLFGLFMVSVFLKGRQKQRFFSSLVLRIIGGLVVISDAYVVYLIVSDVLVQKTGQSEIGSTTVWASYLLLSIALMAFLLYETGLLPNPLPTVRLPKTDEERFLVPKPLRRLGSRRSQAGSATGDPEGTGDAAGSGGPADAGGPTTPPKDPHA